MKRTSKIISIFLTLIIISGLVVITLVSVIAIGNYGVNLDRDCYIPNNSQLNPYSKPQCTWFCWGRTYEKLGIRLPLWHNANTWDESAEADPHYTIGTEARNNSIMVENSSGTGHVAFVEKVENGYAYITEGNYAGSVYHEDRINLSTMIRDSWANHVLSSVRYIYLKCTTHKWDNGKVTTKPTCIKDGVKTYTCTVCGEKKTETIKHSAKYHSYSVTKCVKATLFANGKLEKQCKHCKKKVTETIYHHKSTVLKKKTYTYSGKNNKPGVTVKDIKNKVIPSKYYSISYSNNKYVGPAKAKITFKGRYSGTKKLGFKIIPKGTTISKLSGGTKSITVKWKKQATQTTGYQIQYATNSKFTKGKKTVTTSSNKTTSKKISKLKNNTKYYVRIRTYKKVHGLKYYSGWSKSKTVKTAKASVNWKSMYTKYVTSHMNSMPCGGSYTFTITDQTPFALHDLDMNGVPELIVGNAGARLGLYFYTIHGGKVVYAGGMGGKSIEYSTNKSYHGIFRWDSVMAGLEGGVGYGTISNGKLVEKAVMTFKYDQSTMQKHITVKNKTLYNVYTKGTKDLGLYFWQKIKSKGWNAFFKKYNY